MVRSK
jgi:hypothetical protein